MPQKMLHGRMEGKRRSGRPRRRWMQHIEEDLKRMQVKRWWEKIWKSEEWGSLVRDGKANPRL
jgi:hypothetical protein